MLITDQKKITIQQLFINLVGKRDFNTKKDKGAFVLYKCKGSFFYVLSLLRQIPQTLRAIVWKNQVYEQ